jgi:stalled ribosome alternative rescue factor ArfA
MKGTVMRKSVVKRNPMAKALASPLFHKRVIAAKKGKGAYSRKHKQDYHSG